MIRATWHWIGRVCYWAAAFILRLPFFNTKPRVRVLVIDQDGRILMIKSWFSHQNWALPGGGIKLNESASNAAIREVAEETGLMIGSKQLTHLGLIPPKLTGKLFAVELFKVHIDAVSPHILGRRSEIIAEAWLTRKQIPDSLAFVQHALTKV